MLCWARRVGDSEWMQTDLVIGPVEFAPRPVGAPWEQSPWIEYRSVVAVTEVGSADAAGNRTIEVEHADGLVLQIHLPSAALDEFLSALTTAHASPNESGSADTSSTPAPPAAPPPLPPPPSPPVGGVWGSERYEADQVVPPSTPFATHTDASRAALRATGWDPAGAMERVRSDRSVWLPSAMALVAALSVLLPWVNVQAVVFGLSAAPYRSWRGLAFVAGMVGAAAIGTLFSQAARWRTPTLRALFGVALGLTLGLLVRVLTWSSGPVSIGPDIGLLVALVASALAFTYSMKRQPEDTRIALAVGVCGAVLGAGVVFLGTGDVGPSLDEANDGLETLLNGDELPREPIGEDERASSPNSNLSVREWVLKNPRLQADVEEGGGLMMDISDAADDYSIGRMKGSCAELLSWGEYMQAAYSDSPLVLWDSTISDVVAAAEACLDDDFETAATYIRSAGDGFTSMSDEIS